MGVHRLEDVFGIIRDIPLTYVVRDYVDNQLEDSLKRSQPIVIYGSSKQGKTCVRKRCIPEKDSVIIQCTDKMNLKELNSAILKKAGFELTISQNRTLTGASKIKATAGLAWFINAKVESELDIEKQSQTSKAPLDLDLNDINDLIFALDTIKFNKVIILDDFHYLNLETQKDFGVQLKALYDNSKYQFIIVGVWLEQNRLITLNSDLSGRIVSINADEWTIEDLKKVITKGEALLNIEISDTIKEQIIEESYGNVSVVQEICKRICQFYKISKTLADTFYIGASPAIDQEEYYSNPSRIKISDIVRDLVDQQTGKYQTFLIGLTEGYEAKHEELYKWILLSLLCVEADELYSCLHYRRIKKVISWKHPEGENISSNELTKALKSLNGAQISKKLIPNIIDYDENLLKLSVIDKGFIIWLNYQDKKELLHMLGFNDCEDIIAQFKELEKSSNS